MIELGVLADDLTGGMIVASLIQAAGVRCPLVTDASHLAALPGDVGAVVLARKIRLIPADAAREEARVAAAAFKHLGVKTVYYKYCATFDSTAKGNIGPISETLIEALGGDRTVFCPVYLDRTVKMYKGHLFLGARLVTDTPKRFDPMTPAVTPSIVEQLRIQTPWRVGLIELETLSEGLGAVERAFVAKPDCRFWVIDAISDTDLSRIAALTRNWPLVTGGDSLAPSLIRDRFPGVDAQSEHGRRWLPPTPGREALIAGSCNPATLGQLAAFETRFPLRRIDLAAEADKPGLVDEIAAWAAERLRDGPVGVATTAAPDGVAAAQAMLGREGASARADRILGEIAQRLRALGVRKFIIAGGETSGAVLKALDARRLEVAAYDELFGGYCHSADATPTSFVVKAGSMGDENFFDMALSRMREAERRES